MKPRSLQTFSLAIGLAMAIAACSSKNEAGTNGTNATDTTAATDTGTPAASGSPSASGSPAASDHAAQFLTDAIQGDNAEIAFGKKAQDMGSTQGVKDFGKTLVDDHGKAKDQAAKVAKQLNVPVPDGVAPESQKMIDMATSMSGKGFDKDFLNDMVDDHKKVIAKFEEEAKSSDPKPVVDLAKAQLPTLKKHLSIAESLQKKA